MRGSGPEAGHGPSGGTGPEAVCEPSGGTGPEAVHGPSGASGPTPVRELWGGCGCGGAQGNGRQSVVLVIPAYNEEDAIGRVLSEIPRAVPRAVIVVDNGSTDQTAQVARDGGAHVVREPRRGYGRACLTGIQAARAYDPDILVFLDGDHSDYPEQLPRLIEPICRDGCDFVIGSRMRGCRLPGSMLPQARFGNWLASTLMRLGWGAEYSDLGPFRAITSGALERLNMSDENYGWTVEMQIKAVEADLRYEEVPVDYRPRIGVSKITGTVRGTVGASAKILRVLGSYWWTRGRRSYD